MGRLWVRLAVRVAVTVFILWHAYAVVLWDLPANIDLTSKALAEDSPIRNYMVASGFMQGWAMFAPDPYSFDVYVTAKVHYANGQTRDWSFPRMYTMSYWKRYQKERWRKYIEISYSDGYKFLWPTMCRYVARVNNVYPGNPPVVVDLTRHWRYVRPPGTPQDAWGSYQFITAQIPAEALH